MFILIGKLFYLALWGFLLLNLVRPFPGAAHALLIIALAGFVLIHGLQAWLLSSTLTRQERERDRFLVLRAFLFGVFEALSWKKKQQQKSDQVN